MKQEDTLKTEYEKYVEKYLKYATVLHYGEKEEIEKVEKEFKAALKELKCSGA